MNIVYLVEDYSENGGVENIISMKANTLYQQYNYQVTLISVYQDNRPSRYQLDPHIPLILLNVPFAQKNKKTLQQTLNRVKTIALAACRLNKEIRRIKPDVIFFATTLGALLLPLCHTKARKIYESHLARSYNHFNKMFWWMELAADNIVCLTQGDAKEYKWNRHVRVIPNFINLPQQTVKDYSSKKAIAVGRLEDQKNFNTLICLWSEIVKRYPDWQLDIYGEGSQHQELQSLIDRLKVGKHVRLCGRHDNIMELYPQYSLHLMTSHCEGLPMVMIEAQACGLPSVTFDFPFGASDIVKNGYNGFIAKPYQTTQYMNDIYELLDSPKLREQMGQNARQVGKRFAKEQVFHQWIELLNNH